jgi:hypothetical protein
MDIDKFFEVIKEDIIKRFGNFRSEIEQNVKYYFILERKYNALHDQ